MNVRWALEYPFMVSGWIHDLVHGNVPQSICNHHRRDGIRCYGERKV